MRKYRLCALLTAVLMLFVGCGGDTDTAPTTTTAAVTTTVPTTTTTTAAPTTTTTTKPLEYNPLTGVYDMAAGSNTRAVGIMVGNDKKSRPQVGLDKADWYIETETEGGISRIMAIFANCERVPSQLGPIRSARTPFVKLAQSLDLIYTHAGGSEAAKALLEELDLADVNALHYEGSTFWRDKTLRRERGYEYSLLTSGAKLAAHAKRKSYRTASKNGIPFTFDGDAAVGNGAAKIQCDVSSRQTVSFQYDADAGLYYKSNGTLKSGDPHKSTAGAQIAVSNVVILFDRRYAENDTTSTYELESGEGLLFTAGKARPIRFDRTAKSLTFTEADGSKAVVSTGKTYILLVNKTLKDGTFYRA